MYVSCTHDKSSEPAVEGPAGSSCSSAVAGARYFVRFVLRECARWVGAV